MQRQPLFSELLARRELIGNFVTRNLKQRYKGSALGFFWSLLHPLFLMLVYWVFIRLMKFPMEVSSLLVGVLVWQFTTLCTGDAAGVILGNASLVKKTWFPRVILPLSTALGNLVHFTLSLVALVLLLPFFGHWPNTLWLHLPWVVLAHFVFCLGITLAVSALNVLFRDVEHLVPIVLMAWFFVTPVLYSPDIVTSNTTFPLWARQLYFANPMSALLSYYRHGFLGEPLPAAPLWPGLAAALAMFAIGAWLFARIEPRFADEL